MQYTKVPGDTFENLQLNAGILVDGFEMSNGVPTYTSIIGATGGGVTHATNPEFTDWGEDIDNIPNNTMELKRVKSYDATLSGTFKAITPTLMGMLIASGAVDSQDATHYIPSHKLTTTDFKDIAWIGDYSDKNDGTTAGYLIVVLHNTLNTTGFQIQSNDDGKGDFAFEFHAHYSIKTPDTPPFEYYIKKGTAVTSGGNGTP